MSAPATVPSSPLVLAILEGRAPAPVMLSAARGVLPLSRAELLRVLVFLIGEEDGAVREMAEATLATIKDDELVVLVADPSTAVDVLDHFAGLPSASPTVRNAILANPSTADQTLRQMIPSLSSDQIDELLLNQRRLIDTPGLLELLEQSRANTALQRSKIEEIRRHFLARTDAVSTGVGSEAPSADEPTTAEPSEHGTIEQGEDPVAAQKIMRMTTAEKMKLAFRATREERMILIRDTSRSVQSAVLDCPMLTEQDLEQIAKMRSVSEDVLRAIAGNRSWMRNYQVLFSLTTNPKTPMRVAMNLVAMLNARDIKAVVLDKNVPETVRRQARKVMDARNARQGRRL